MKKHEILFLVGFTIWIIGSWHGGFQAEPQSNFEGYTDFVGTILMFWGIAGDILNGVQIHKNTNITTDSVTLENANVIKK